MRKSPRPAAENASPHATERRSARRPDHGRAQTSGAGSPQALFSDFEPNLDQDAARSSGQDRQRVRWWTLWVLALAFVTGLGHIKEHLDPPYGLEIEDACSPIFAN